LHLLDRNIDSFVSMEQRSRCGAFRKRETLRCHNNFPTET
jgi:hypothetical protein